MKPLEYYFVERWEKEWNPLALILGLGNILGWIVLHSNEPTLTKSFVFVNDSSIIQTYTTLFDIMSVIAFIGGIACLFHFFFLNNKQVSGIIEDEPIYSMRNRLDQEGSMSGMFFLGIGGVSGSMDQQEYYVYYKKGDYGLIKDKLEVEEVEVIITNKHKPSKKIINIQGEEKTFLFVPKKTIKQKITLTT